MKILLRQDKFLWWNFYCVRFPPIQIMMKVIKGQYEWGNDIPICSGNICANIPQEFHFYIFYSPNKTSSQMRSHLTTYFPGFYFDKISCINWIWELEHIYLYVSISIQLSLLFWSNRHPWRKAFSSIPFLSSIIFS